MSYVKTEIQKILKVDEKVADMVFDIMCEYEDFDFSESSERKFKSSARACYEMYQEGVRPYRPEEV